MSVAGSAPQPRILSGRRVGSLWRQVAASLKSAVARGVVDCPGCGCSVRVAMFEARTQRTEQSPDLILYALPPR